MEIDSVLNFISNSLVAKILLGLILIYLTFITFADPPGYCSSQKRYISDEEFIRIAIQQEKTSMNIDGSEESIRTFHAKNPDCCTVNKRQTQYSSRFLYGPVHSVEVFFQYELSTAKVVRDPANKYYDAWTTIDVCGKPLENWGISKDHYYHSKKQK